MIFFLLWTLIPCVLKWLCNVLMKKMIHSSTYVQVNPNNVDQNSTSLHIPDPYHYPSSDSDSDDDILFFVLVFFVFFIVIIFSPLNNCHDDTF